VNVTALLSTLASLSTLLSFAFLAVALANFVAAREFAVATAATGALVGSAQWLTTLAALVQPEAVDVEEVLCAFETAALARVTILNRSTLATALTELGHTRWILNSAGVTALMLLLSRQTSALSDALAAMVAGACVLFVTVETA